MSIWQEGFQTTTKTCQSDRRASRHQTRPFSICFTGLHAKQPFLLNISIKDNDQVVVVDLLQPTGILRARGEYWARTETWLIPHPTPTPTPGPVVVVVGGVLPPPTPGPVVVVGDVLPPPNPRPGGWGGGVVHPPPPPPPGRGLGGG